MRISICMEIKHLELRFNVSFDIFGRSFIFCASRSPKSKFEFKNYFQNALHTSSLWCLFVCVNESYSYLQGAANRSPSAIVAISFIYFASSRTQPQSMCQRVCCIIVVFLFRLIESHSIAYDAAVTNRFLVSILSVQLHLRYGAIQFTKTGMKAKIQWNSILCAHRVKWNGNLIWIKWKRV